MANKGKLLKNHIMNFTRKNLLRFIGVALPLLTLTASVSAQTSTSTNRPNLVFILCDDLGYGDIHALNPEHGKIPTPNVDRLSAEGMTFTDCHASSSICSPSRYSLLTGRYDWRTRLQHGVLGGDGEPLLESNRLTVAELLKQHGYTTAIIGKWHLGLQFDKDDFTKPITDGPLQHGFDYFFGIAASLDMSPYDYIENNRWTEVPSARKKFPSFIYGDINAGPGPNRLGPAAPDFDAVNVLPEFTRKAVGYISQCGADKKPFFLLVTLPSPHTPLVPTKEWQGKSGLGPYGDYVMETDDSAGQILKAIDAAGLRDNTIAIFASDNGAAPYAGVDKLAAAGHFVSAQYRGYKSDIWDGGQRIPFIVRWPGKIEPASRSRQIVGLFDLFATCADILHAKLPDNAGEDSVSLLPAFLGIDMQPLHADNTIVNHSGGNGRFAIRQGKWKLELCPGSGGWGQPGDEAALKEGLPVFQLYNLDNDIGEQTNLLHMTTEGEQSHIEMGKYGPVVTNLVKLLEKYVANGRSTPGASQTNDVPVDIWSNKSVNNQNTNRRNKNQHHETAAAEPAGKVTDSSAGD
jgi:arylsulfatase A-like enzyme